MNTVTDVIELAIGNALFLGQPFPPITEWHIALFTGGAGVMGHEFVGNGYARARQDPSPTTWAQRPYQNNGHTVYYNLTTIVFPNPTASWGTAGWFGLIDQSDQLCFAALLDTPRTINAGEAGPVFLPGELEIEIG